LVLDNIKNGLNGVIIRPTKVYGVGEHEYSYLTLAKLCKKGFFPKIGRGANYTSNIYISDFVQALVKLVDNGLIGETYILTSNESISLIETGNIIADVLKKRIIVIPIPEKIMIFLASLEERFFIFLKKKPIVTKRNIEATISDRVYDISKAKREIGFEPVVTMKDGIRKVVNWYIDKRLV